MASPVFLSDMQEYYILLGKNANDTMFMPLLIDMISKKQVGSCIDSENIGTIFQDKDSARKAKDLLLAKYSEIKVAQLKIIGYYARE